MKLQNKLLIYLFIFVIVLILIIPFLVPFFYSGIFEDLQSSLKEHLNSDEVKPINYLFQVYLFFDFISKIVGVLGLLGILGLYISLEKERHLDEAQFTMNISNNFIGNKELQKVYEKLERSNEQKSSPFEKETPDYDEIVATANYISFFEPIYNLIKKRLISWETVDQFQYRFFLVTNNKYVQEKLLCKEGKEDSWTNIFKLHKEWKKYREKKYGKEEREFDLSREYKSLYDRITKGS